MEFASSSVRRNALQLAHEYAKAGLAFVCVPVNTDDQREEATAMASRNLDSMINESEQSS